MREIPSTPLARRPGGFLLHCPSPAFSLVLHGLHKLSGLAAPFPPARRYPTGITLPRAGRAKRRHAGGRAAFTTGLKAGALAAIWVPARPAPAVPRPGPPWGPCVPGLAAIAGRRNA